MPLFYRKKNKKTSLDNHIRIGISRNCTGMDIRDFKDMEHLSRWIAKQRFAEGQTIRFLTIK